MAARGTLGKGFKGMLFTNPFFNVWVGEAYLFLFSNKGCDKLKRKKQRNKTKTLLLIVGIIRVIKYHLKISFHRYKVDHTDYWIEISLKMIY